MKKITLILALFISITSFAQPFRNEIDAFKKKDSAVGYTKGLILFTGSSSFTKWQDVQEFFPMRAIINRAFGGSTLLDLIRYADEAIINYQPKQIVIYCGENDVAASDTVTAQMVLQRFKTLFTMIRAKLKRTQITYVSMKPSPSRWRLRNIYVEGNKLIQDFLAGQKNTDFINIYDAMLNPDGSVMTDIFLSDNLHMNRKGYNIWQPIIAPYLKK